MGENGGGLRLGEGLMVGKGLGLEVGENGEGWKREMC